MVARITHSSKMSSVLNYNEKKVSQNAAELIHASGRPSATPIAETKDFLDDSTNALICVVACSCGAAVKLYGPLLPAAADIGLHGWVR